jgi:hypothetical protein
MGTANARIVASTARMFAASGGDDEPDGTTSRMETTSRTVAARVAPACEQGAGAAIAG